MNILVLGFGAREHAITWKIRQSQCVQKIYVAPGNAGTRAIATNLDIDPSNAQEIVRAVRCHAINLVVVGPEGLLANGIVDTLSNQGIQTFGPTKKAALLETSKSFAIGLMKEARIPHPQSWICKTLAEARQALVEVKEPPVVKLNGLAGGKGVIVCSTMEEAENTVKQYLALRPLEPVIIQERLSGPEVSVFCFTDGKNISALIPACDHKHAEDQNRGLMTGGMGSYSEPAFWTTTLEQRVRETIARPTICAMATRRIPFCGVLFMGLMITKEGPKVLEYNCRLGDPETQVILPRLKTDIVELMTACLNGTIKKTPLLLNRKTYVGVVIASSEYPRGQGSAGQRIIGLEKVAENPRILVFHGDTLLNSEGEIVTGNSSGRKLTIVGESDSPALARAVVYPNVLKIQIPNTRYRSDIGL